jgi:hypothetical protein
MGLPLSRPGEVLLKLNQQSLLGKAIYKLSSGDDKRSYRHIPPVYVSVDADYERHIQALGIALHGEVTEGDPVTTEIEDHMLARLRELVEHEPLNPLYHAILGTYEGDMSQAVELLLRDDLPVPNYARGTNPAAFWKAEWLFAASIALKRMED